MQRPNLHQHVHESAPAVLALGAVGPDDVRRGFEIATVIAATLRGDDGTRGASS